MTFMICLIVFLIVTGIFCYQRVSLLISTAALAVALVVFSLLMQSVIAISIVWLIFAIIFIPLNLPILRRQLLSSKLFRLYKKFMPPMSETEKAALEAGDVWWDGELFSGKPDWSKLFAYPEAKLTDEERAFIEGPVETLANMVCDYKICYEDRDLPPAVWQFLKDQGFYGLVIPKNYGGLGFSPYAYGRICEKLFSASITLATTVAVPSSLGPGELLSHYGTEAQKDYYLPRLARGEEIPCFALTGPHSGSDAGSMPDHGIVCKGEFDGKEVIGMRLNFEKRYITLAPIATVIGLAFKLYDPEHLLGDKEELGITCALIQRNTVGITIGRRHFPSNNPFQNGPISGKDVFVPIDWIIGGSAMAGQGWRMLMECLAIGRAISLPSSGVAGTKTSAFTTGAYARIRKQFDVPIAKFEGIKESLARIAGSAYWGEAVFKFTLGALNNGVAPAVPSGIAKYHLTEAGRSAANDGMDVQSGKAVMVGPNNYLSQGYQGVPIGITVEGANILTRSLIIFGQGAMRCHPYVLKEIQAVRNENTAQGLIQFDQALFGHIGFTLSNMARSFWMGVTSSHFTRMPKVKAVHRYFQHLNRFSAAFAFSVDVAMLTLGGSLKRRELLSARFADVLSKLYILSAVLKRFVEDGCHEEDLPLVHWSVRDGLYTIQEQLEELYRNFPNKIVARLLRLMVFPLGRRFNPPRDTLSEAVADIITTPGAARERVINGIYRPKDLQYPKGVLEAVFNRVTDTEQIEHIVDKAYKRGEIKGFSFAERVNAAVTKGLITANDGQVLLDLEPLRARVIAVDDFSVEELTKN